MRIRLLSLPGLAVFSLLALLLPAQAEAQSFPNKAGNYVSDHVEYFVGALVVAILLLLLSSASPSDAARRRQKNR